MEWLRRLGHKRPWDLATLPRPWTGPALYEFIRARLGADGRLSQDAAELPDGLLDPHRVRFAPGALDGIVGHHTMSGGDGNAERLTTLILGLANEATATRLRDLFEAVRGDGILGRIDDVLKGVATAQPPRARIAAIGRLFAREAPEREAVKLGLGLVGIAGDLATDRPMVEALAAHDEFTLFAAIALSNLGAGMRDLWQLAKRVDGWGRIQVVERLTGTNDPEIRAWLLRDGFRNEIMVEYLALDCAVFGGLAEALEGDVDDALFEGASVILTALAGEGPAGTLGGYPEAERAIRAWLRVIEQRPMTVRVVAALDALVASGELPPEVRPAVEAARTSPAVNATIEQGLASSDMIVFGTAHEAAHAHGLDVLPGLLEHAAAGERYARFHLFRDIPSERMRDALTAISASLDLADLATGPGEDIGLGDAYANEAAAEDALAGLQRTPGLGMDIVHAALQNRVIRLRWAAVRTLRTWGEAAWPAQARQALEAARDREPVADLRADMDALLRGEPPPEEGPPPLD